MNMNDVKMLFWVKRLDTLNQSLKKETEHLIKIIENQNTKN